MKEVPESLNKRRFVGLQPLSFVLCFVASLLATSAVAVEKVSVQALFKGMAVLVIDGKRRTLRNGQTSPEGVKLISADSKEAVLEIDGKQDKYGLGTRIGTSFAPPEQQPSVQIWPTPRGMYEVTGSINGYPVKFLVDTGATLIAMNAPQARRLGIDFRVDGRAGLSSTASGIAKTFAIKLDRVRVGDIQLKDVDAAVIDGNFPREVLLGNSFLNRVEMKREGKALMLRKRF